MRLLLVCLLVCVALCGEAYALIEKQMLLCPQKQQLCPYFKAVMPVPSGWKEDTENGPANRIVILTPQEKNWHSAAAAVYSHAEWDENKVDTIENHVAESIAIWKREHANVRVIPMGTVKRSKNKTPFYLTKYINADLTVQPAEIVATTTDIDNDNNRYFVNITLTGKSEKAVQEAEATYKKLLESY